MKFGTEHESSDLEEPFVLQIEDIPYCYVHLISIYADLFLSKKTNTNGLFSPQGMKYCNYKFGLSRDNPANISEINQGIDKIFSLHVPYDFNYSKLIYSQMVGRQDEQCGTCSKTAWCEDKNLKELEVYLAKLFEWRSYDEFEKLRLFVRNLISDADKKNNQVISQDLINGYLTEVQRVNKSLHVVLPKVKSFFNLLTAISIPLRIAGFGAEINAATSAVIATTAGVDIFAKIYEDKYKWIGFKVENLDRKIVE